MLVWSTGNCLFYTLWLIDNMKGQSDVIFGIKVHDIGEKGIVLEDSGIARCHAKRG